MTDRGPPLILDGRGQIAQTGHYLCVDNTGIVSDHVTQEHMALNESRQDSCYTKFLLVLVLVEPLGLSSTSSSCGPFPPWNASAKGSDVFF